MMFQKRSDEKKKLVLALDIQRSGKEWKFTSRAGTQIRNVMLQKSTKNYKTNISRRQFHMFPAKIRYSLTAVKNIFLTYLVVFCDLFLLTCWLYKWSLVWRRWFYQMRTKAYKDIIVLLVVEMEEIYLWVMRKCHWSFPTDTTPIVTVQLEKVTTGFSFSQ